MQNDASESVKSVGPSCTLLVHKPVTTHTLVGVICKTPVRSKLSLDRRPKDSIPGIERIKTIGRLALDEGAHLLPTAKTRRWQTDIQVSGDYVVEDTTALGSWMEVLDLAGRRDVRHALLDPERRPITEYKLSYGVRRYASRQTGAVGYTAGYESRHLQTVPSPYNCTCTSYL